MIPNNQLSADYLEDFRIIKQLGQGGQAAVKLGELGGDLFAIKIYREIQNKETLLNELKILKMLEHPNIIKVHNIIENAKYKEQNGNQYQCLAIALEYNDGGELFQYLSYTKKFEIPIARAYFKMIIEALGYMHSKGITHRDLKPQNILLDRQSRLKIIDFGLATFLNRGQLHTRLGTPSYVPPELWEGNYQGNQVDLFAAGIILFIITTGFPPFANTRPNDPHYYCFKEPTGKQKYWNYVRGRLRNEANQIITPLFVDLIDRMLDPKPSKRLNAQQILNHKWMQNQTASPNQIQHFFANRHLIVAQQQQRLRQRRQRELDQNRSGQTDHIEDIRKLIYFKESDIEQSTETNQSDFIIKQTAQTFVIQLYEFLMYKEKNLVIDESLQELFQIQNNEGSNEINIKLTYKQFEQEFTFQITLKLSKTKDDRLKIQFIPEDNRLIGYQLVTILKDGFADLKKKQQA